MSDSCLFRFSKCRVLFCLTCIFSFPSIASANTHALANERSGYSFLGVGVSIIDYEESSTLRIDGIPVDIETDSSSLFTQRSGTFVSINRNWGFYLNTLTTLGVPKSNETWELNDVIIRSNSVAFQYQRLELLGNKALTIPDTHLMFGVQYSNFEFQRFGAQLSDAAANFNIDESIAQTGTVSETLWDVTTLFGIERTSLFTERSRKWQYQARALLGTPLISNVVNTSIANGKSFSESFNGLEVRLSGLLGYRLNDNFVLAGEIELTATRRNSVSGAVDGDTGTTAFPATTFLSVLPSLSVYWAF